MPHMRRGASRIRLEGRTGKERAGMRASRLASHSAGRKSCRCIRPTLASSARADTQDSGPGFRAAGTTGHAGKAEDLGVAEEELLYSAQGHAFLFAPGANL